MSETDRAFIRAYQQQCAEPPTSAPPTTARPAPSPAASYPAAAPPSMHETQLRVDVPPPAPSAVVGGSRVPTPHLQISASGPAWMVIEPAAKESARGEAAAPAAKATTTPQAPQPIENNTAVTRAPSLWGRRTPAPAAANPASTDVQRENVAAAAQSPLRLHLGIEQTLERLEGDRRTEIETQAAALDSVASQLSIIAPAVEEDEDEATEQIDVDTDAQCESDTPSTVVSDDPAVGSSRTRESSGEKDIATDDSDTHDNEEARSLTTSATESETESVALQPQWEVDAFQWPALVDQLGDQAHEAIVVACEALAAAAADGMNVLAVTGVDEDCGATTLALTLARHLAAGGLRVALVDADFDTPVLAERLGIRATEGWEATLEGRQPADEVCIASVDDNIVLVPLVAGDGVSSTMASMNAATQIEKLSRAFDLVLIDAGSGSENVAAVATSSDETLDVAVLLAVDERHADRDAAKEVIARLRLAGLRHVHLAETFVSY